MQQYAEREDEKVDKKLHKVAETRTKAKSNIGRLVVADGTRRPSVLWIVSSSATIEKTKKEMTCSTFRYRVDSSADHINSTAGREIKRG